MKKTKILPIIIGVVVFIALAVGAVFLWKGLSAKPEEGTKNITFTVIGKDQNAQEFKIKTEREYLANALADENLITYDESGFYTVINGETADYSADGSWWCIKKDGADLTVGMNEQPIADGENYQAVFTKG